MKIGIDGTPLSTPFPCGTRHYAENLLKAISKIDKKNQYYIYSSKEVDIPKQRNFHLVLIPRIPIMKKQLFLAVLASRDKLDIFHYLEPFGSIFLRHPKIITTIHDLYLGQTYPYNSKYLINRIYCEIIRRVVAKNTSFFITDTESIKRELELYTKTLGIRKKIETIPLSPDKIFRRVITKRSKTNFFLCMGDFSKRKNVRRIFMAFSSFGRTLKNEYGLKLLISTKAEGKHFKEMARDLKISKYVQILVDVSNRQLRNYYNNAIAFVYPSLYEGFGLPILEAMACGCPVITSDYGAMKEVAGKAAILVHPTSVDSIAGAMYKISRVGLFRRRIIQKGLRRVKIFSWNRTAKSTLAVYNKVLRENSTND